MRKLFAAILLSVSAMAAGAQDWLNGKVVDKESNEPLVGVNVYVPALNIGTSTDADGEFALDLDTSGVMLAFSYVGYQKKLIKYTGQDHIQIAMQGEVNLEEIVISAFRATENAPVTKTTLQEKDIEKIYVGQDATFVLAQSSPSIVAYSESGTNFSNYSQFRLRGIDQTRVNITFNGAPINDMIDQGVFFSNITDLANNVESVQIQRGVGTSTNGTASFAGSVNFESDELKQEKPSAEMELVGGSFNTYRGSIGVNSGLKENKWAVSSRFTTFTSDGYRYNTQTTSRSFYGSAGYFGDRDLVKITGFIGRSQNGLAYSPVALSDIEDDPRTNYLNENDRDDFGQWFLQAQHTHLFHDQLSIVSSLYYGGAGGDFFFTFEDGNGGLDQINYPLRNDHVGLMSNVNYHSSGGNFNAYGGIHAYTFRRTNWEELMPDKANPYYTERSNKDEVSLFAKADLTLGSFQLYGDLQFRTLSLDIDPDQDLLPGQGLITKNWTFLNPRVGITYLLDAYKSLYFSYGRSGREPTKVDLFGGFQLNSSNLPEVQNNAVRPEYVNDFEAGINFSYAWLSGQLNGFYMKFTDEIAPIGEYVPEGFLQLRKNMPSSFRAGVELDFRLKIVEKLHLDGQATFMKSQIDTYAPEGDQVYTDVTPALSPEVMGSGTLNYELGKRFSLSLTGRYVGESFQEPTNNPEFIMPDFFVADASFSVKFGEKNHFDIFLNNIFNTRYYTYGAPVDVDFDGTFDEAGYFVQPPRNFYAKLVLGL